jgi:hypothetical protein
MAYVVLLFGDVKAAAGLDALLVPLQAGGAPHTPRTLLAALRHNSGVTRRDGQPFIAPPAWADTVLPTWLAVDLEYVSHDGPDGMDRALPVKSEIALIPPISGG